MYIAIHNSIALSLSKLRPPPPFLFQCKLLPKYWWIKCLHELALGFAQACVNMKRGALVHSQTTSYPSVWGGAGERERRLFKHSSGHFSPLQHCSGLGENWPLVNLIFFPRSHFQVLQTAASSSSMKEGVAHVAHFTFLRFLLTIAKLILLLALLLTNTNLSRGR